VKRNKVKNETFFGCFYLKRKIGSETKRKEVKEAKNLLNFFDSRSEVPNAFPSASFRFKAKWFEAKPAHPISVQALVYTQTFLCSKKFNVASWQLELGEQV
jgi:hypothetical protein